MSVSEPTKHLLLPNNLEWKDFTDLTAQECNLVLQWRNAPEVKKWMRTDQSISPQEHDRFIKGLKGAKDKAYFLLYYSGNPIGVTDLYKISLRSRSCYYGYYLDPKLIGTSWGMLMELWVAETALIRYQLQMLVAETKPDNPSALQMHDFFGFVPQGINNDGLQEAILTNQAWSNKRHEIHPFIKRFFV